MARVNATPRKLSRGTGATARGRHGLGYLDRGLAVLGKQKSEVGSSFAIEHLPYRGRDARHCEPYEVKVETGACAHGRAGSAGVPWGHRQHTWAPISETSRSDTRRRPTAGVEDLRRRRWSSRPS